ncbi:DNA polymerase III subunit gamma/tau [Paenibacillus sp. IB182496]|uniref:DNA-directed DNA polymerase n=1 Tax=Paenibacillus sabuli TaxID=2772509 RepID=A0A927BTX4_9BACL|nr:DNA polymerase III subunit gamma/tau [Paenibacillus sabuli]MBD2845605.1 DNA polymerase III subunit gamma/tau [Paenibacillus sabuli]
MSHIALYRAWRPQTFQDMVGQKHIIQTLQNAISEQRISHAYLFNGPRGTGKTTAAKVFAKAINCQSGPAREPCNSCDACRGITDGTIMDVIEIDAASNRGIDEIRDIRDKVRYAPSEVRFKVYIIDEVHMLTAEAFNALLKTLEEPPGHVVFILATTEPHKLPATIISRCQRFDFRQVSLEEQTARLRFICEDEGLEADEEALVYIARLSDGGMRDAISLLEQVAAFAAGRMTLDDAVDVTGGMAAEQFAQLAEAVQHRDVAAVLELVNALALAGKSADKCLENLIYYFRDLLLLKLVPGGESMTERIVDGGRFRAMADAYEQERLFSMIDVLHHYQVEMKHALQPQTLLEVALLKICTLADASSSEMEGRPADPSSTAADSGALAELKRQVEQLERQLAQLQRGDAGQARRTPPGTGVRAPAAASPSGPGLAQAPQRSQGGRPPANGAPGIRRSGVKLEPYVQAFHSPEFQQIRMRWSEALQRVKEAGISIHAWLINGEPVSALPDSVLVAFKNTIHRETTEKPANREVIERVLRDTFGIAEMSFATVMLKEWQEAAQNGPAPAEEAFELQPGDEPPAREEQRPEWVEEAYKLFGEELVVVQDDE